MEPEEYDQLYEAELDHWRFRAMRRVLLEALRRERARRGGAPLRVLDAGCGCGGTTLSLTALGTTVGVDAHPRALAFAARRGALQLVRASVGALPFPDASFDAAISADVLYHRAVSDDAAALREIGRVCRPGGPVLLWLPAYDWLRSAHDDAVHTVRRYDRRRVRALARSAGLEAEQVSGVQAPLLPLAIARRLLERRSSGPRVARLQRGPRPIGAALEAILAVEGAALGRISLPFGLSIFARLRRPS